MRRSRTKPDKRQYLFDLDMAMALKACSACFTAGVTYPGRKGEFEVI